MAVVANGEPASLGSQISRLLDDNDRRRAMGEAGRRAVEAKFTWKAISRDMLDVYAHALRDNYRLFLAWTSFDESKTVCLLPDALDVP